jgi:hypothetical protein
LSGQLGKYDDADVIVCAEDVDGDDGDLDIEWRCDEEDVVVEAGDLEDLPPLRLGEDDGGDGEANSLGCFGSP